MVEGLVGGVVEGLVDRLAARLRQISHDHAELLTDLVAVADDCPVAEFAPMEIAAALTWTRRTATAQLELARTVVIRLPAVHAALSAGQIDLPKAQVIAEGVACLDSAAACLVVEQILPQAPGLTTGELRARLSKLVIAVDPDAAAVKHRQRVAERRVVLQPDQDSCASIFGLDLPADRATAAAQRLSELARAAKRAGDPRSMDQLRADAFLDLICGGTPSGRAGSVELTCSLETLVWLASHPGDLAGYGPVIADIARQVAEQQQAAMWTYRIHDDETGEVFHGITRRRPSTAPPRPDRSGSSRLQPGAAPGSALRPPAGASPEHVGAQRRPDAATARLIRSRDRTCRAAGCRAPAQHTDIDHTIAWEHGGRTIPGNLGLLCRYHHRAKHEGGWLLFQIAPGHFIWRSPLGKLYHIEPHPP